MSKKKQKFIDKLELFYRNFGNEWNLNEIIPNQEQHDFYFSFLLELEKQKIIEIDSKQKTFKIIDLPSKYISQK